MSSRSSRRVRATHGLRRAASASALVALVVTGLAACGGDDEPDDTDESTQSSETTEPTEGTEGPETETTEETGDPETPFEELSFTEISDRSVEDMKSLQSVRIKGTFISEDGEDLKMDVTMDNRNNCRGTFVMEKGRASFLEGSEGSFIKGDRDFWVESAGGDDGAQQVLTLLGGKWAKLEADDEGFSEMCDLDEFTGDFTSGGTGEVGEVTTIGGQSAVEITDSSGDSKAYIATEGEHYFLRVSSDKEDDPGEFTLSEFNRPVDVSAPPPSRYVDMGDL